MDDIIHFDYTRIHMDSSFKWETSYMNFHVVNYELSVFEHRFCLNNPSFSDILYSL